MSCTALNTYLGNWLNAQLHQTKKWLRWLLITLLCLVITNIFLHPYAPSLDTATQLKSAGLIFWTVDHPHFDLDAYPGFWPLFGLSVTLTITVILKKCIFPLICRPEDYYERD